MKSIKFMVGKDNLKKGGLEGKGCRLKDGRGEEES